VLEVAGTVCCGQAKDAHGQVKFSQSSLDGDLVVSRVYDNRPQRRFFRQRHGIGWAGLRSPDATECSVHIGARGNDCPACACGEGADSGCVRGLNREHVDHDLGIELAQLGQVSLELSEVAVEVAARQLGFGLVLAAVENQQLVPALGELAYDEWPDEPRTPENENPHKTL
jgi:hypothetical protein